MLGLFFAFQPLGPGAAPDPLDTFATLAAEYANLRRAPTALFRVMRQVEFFKLPRAIQERFLAGAAGTSPPQVWLRYPARTPFPVLWLLGALAGLGILFGLLTLGYGTAGNRLALAPVYMAGVYGAAVWTIALCVMGILSVVSAPGWLPFRPGYYLFPVGVIDAHTHRFVVHPLTDLEQVEHLGKKQLVLRFKGGHRFTFPVPNPERAEALVEAVRQGKEHLAELEGAADAHGLASLDPLLDTGIPSPLLPTERLVRRVPAWSRLALPIALVPALGLAWPIWEIRNVMSERVMYATADAAGTPEAYRAYLETGGPRSEVRDLLLPRAELRVARGSGSVSAVEAVVAKYEGTAVHGELEQALRDLLLGELETARKRRSLTALRQLEKGFTRGDLIEAEIDAALHAVYTDALATYKKQAPPDSKEAVPFFAKLLAHAEKQGPKVVIRFRRELRGTVKAADERVKKSQYYAGAKFIPSQYYEPPYAAKREQRIADRLIARFKSVFASDVLHVELGAPLEQDAPEPAVDVPTLFVTHSTLMSGTYSTRTPLGVYVGIGVVFESSFRLPERADTLDYRLSVWRQPSMDTVKEQGLTPEQVYDGLTGEAFDRFADKLVEQLFKK